MKIHYSTSGISSGSLDVHSKRSDHWRKVDSTQGVKIRWKFTLFVESTTRRLPLQDMTYDSDTRPWLMSTLSGMMKTSGRSSLNLVTAIVCVCELPRKLVTVTVISYAMLVSCRYCPLSVRVGPSDPGMEAINAIRSWQNTEGIFVCLAWLHQRLILGYFFSYYHWIHLNKQSLMNIMQN